MWFGEQWKTIIRYDCAHGFSHIDSYNKIGGKTKTDLKLSLEEALILADEDIKENWEKYVSEFYFK